MHERLVTYAQTFERNPIFKMDMELHYGVVESYIKYGRPSCGTSSIFKHDNPIHIVEQMLESASLASNTNNLKNFKIARQKVLEFLEPQYQRVVAAASEMAAHIKATKKTDELFDTLRPRGVRDFDGLAETYIILRNYSSATSRDLTREIEAQIVLHPRRWELAYTILPRDKMMAELSQRLEDGDGKGFSSLEALHSLFKACVDDIGSQFLSIREARKAVFRDDPVGTTKFLGMSLEDWMQPWICDEHVDWTVNEPHIGPDEDPNKPSRSERSEVLGARGEEDESSHSDGGF